MPLRKQYFGRNLVDPRRILNYSFQHSDVGFDNQRVPSRDTSTLALQFQYPIFEGGAKRARMQGVTAEYNAATNVTQELH